MAQPGEHFGDHATAEHTLGRVLLLLLVAIAYGNAFDGPFVFDDVPAVEAAARAAGANPSAGAVDPGATTSGRPLLLLSLAANHLVSGDAVWSYRLVNVALHALATLLLQSTLIRALRAAAGTGTPRSAVSVPLATFVAACWGVHPLQTAAVSYVVQRAEILASIGVLFGLYGFLRATASRAPRRWLALSVGGCLFGVLAKEVAIVGPFLIMLFDGMFVTRGFRTIPSRRGVYYGCLVGVGLIQLALVAATGGRGGTAGFDSPTGPIDYTLTQAVGILRYIRLVFWPTGLVFDHGTTVAALSVGTLAAAALLFVAIVWIVAGVRRRHPAGFAGSAFFLLLAPSSSVVPIASQVLAEHRMYLASAIPLLALGIVLQRLRIAWLGLVSLPLALLVLTHHRNEVFRDERRLWQDTVAKRPDNARAFHNLGLVELRSGNFAGAAARLETAARLSPAAPDVHFNLGLVASKIGRNEVALEHYRRALALDPSHPQAHNNLGLLLLEAGRNEGAVTHFRAAVRLRPGFAAAHLNLAEACLRHQDARAALDHSREALRLDSGLGAAHLAAGNAAALLGQLDDARLHFETALRRAPDDVRVLSNLGNVLVQQARTEEAIALYRRAVGLNPEFIAARRNLALALLQLGRLREAETELEAWNRLEPGNAQARSALLQVRSQLGR
jgi:tetratricopeptide (TPR) repeat protein